MSPESTNIILFVLTAIISTIGIFAYYDNKTETALAVRKEKERQICVFCSPFREVFSIESYHINHYLSIFSNFFYKMNLNTYNFIRNKLGENSSSSFIAAYTGIIRDHNLLLESEYFDIKRVFESVSYLYTDVASFSHETQLAINQMKEDFEKLSTEDKVSFYLDFKSRKVAFMDNIVKEVEALNYSYSIIEAKLLTDSELILVEYDLELSLRYIKTMLLLRNIKIFNDHDFINNSEHVIEDILAFSVSTHYILKGIESYYMRSL